MNTLKKTWLLVLLVAFGTAGCDQGFEELNENPNDPVTVPSGLLTADVVRNTSNILYSMFVGGDMGGCWVQHWSKVQYNDEALYIPRVSVLENIVWDGLYEDVVSDSKSIERLAIEEENRAMEGVGLTMQAFGYLTLTDLFGAVPFSEALRSDEGIFSPAYDAQQDVYNGVFDLLDRANEAFESGEGEVLASSDLLFNGDAGNWQRFANSLKFRALMRISDRVDVAGQLQELMGRPMFTSNSQEAKLQYLGADPNANPIFETVSFGGRDEFRVNSELIEMLESKNDPRLSVYAQVNDAGEFRGKPSGIFNVPNAEYNYDNVSPIGDFYLDPTLPGYLLSYAELEFLMAEAAMRGLISGDAADHYNNGVRANFAFNGIAGAADDYLANNPYSDMTSIGEQKWLALYGQGVEAWTEWRRTGIPSLDPALESDLGQIPSRYPYPLVEQSINQSGFDAAVQLQGPNTLTTDIWWMGGN